MGAKNWNWHGGSSCGGYGVAFDVSLKISIRDREGHRCLICKRAESEFKELLSVHHIDYNKKNNHPWNLVALCRSCHISTSAHRTAWAEFFRIVNDERGFKPKVMRKLAVAAGS